MNLDDAGKSGHENAALGRGDLHDGRVIEEFGGPFHTLALQAIAMKDAIGRSHQHYFLHDVQCTDGSRITNLFRASI